MATAAASTGAGPPAPSSPSVAPSATSQSVTNDDDVPVLFHAVWINYAVLLASVVAFWLALRSRRLQPVLQPRLHRDARCHRRRSSVLLPDMGDVPDLVAAVGIDGFMFLRTMRTMAIVFAALTLPCIGLCAVNVVTGGDSDDDAIDAMAQGGAGLTLSQLTMTNVSSGSAYLWVHASIAALAAALLAVLWARDCRLFVRLRRRRHHLDRWRTVALLVRRLPPHLQTDARLARYIQGHLPPPSVAGSVVDAHVVVREDGTAADVGFVVLATRSAATALLARAADPSGPTMEVAPEPNDIIWANLFVGRRERRVRRALIWAAVLVVIATFSVPVTVITDLMSLPSIERHAPWLAALIASQPVLQSLFLSVVPTLAFTILIVLTPVVLRVVCRRIERLPTHSAVDVSVFSKFVLVLVVDMFLFSVVAGGALPAALAHPSTIATTIARAFPTQSSSFTLYVLSFSCLSLPVFELLLFPFSLVRWAASRKARHGSDEHLGAIAAGRFDYGLYYPYQILIGLIGLTYVTVAPLVIPFVFLYFAIAGVVFRHQLCNVYDLQYDAGAVFFPMAMRRVLLSGVLALCITMAVLCARGGLGPACALLPCVVALAATALHLSRQCRAAMRLDHVPDADPIGDDDDGGCGARPVAALYRAPWEDDNDEVSVDDDDDDRGVMQAA